MKTTHKSNPISADEIADQADRGEDISHFFTNRGKKMPALQEVRLDCTLNMLEEIDSAAVELHVSRQAIIKTFIRQALDQHYLAQQARKAG